MQPKVIKTEAEIEVLALQASLHDALGDERAVLALLDQPRFLFEDRQAQENALRNLWYNSEYVLLPT